MRIDLTPPSMPELEPSRGSSGTSEGTGASIQSTRQTDHDLATLSTGTAAVNRFKSLLESVPEVRHALVDRLRQAVSDGSFQVSPQAIAEGMLAGAAGRNQ